MLIKKDFGLIFKHKIFYGQFLLTSVFIVIYFIYIKSNLFQEKIFSHTTGVWTAYYTNMSVAVLLIIYLSATGIYPLLAVERDSFLLLRQLPVKMDVFIWNKIISGSAAIVFFSQLLFWGYIVSTPLYLGYDFQFYLHGSFTLLFIAFTIAAVNMSFAMIFHEFEVPILITYKTLLAFFISMVLAFLMLAAAGYAIYAYYLYAVKEVAVYPVRDILLSLVAVFFVGLLVSGILLELGYKKLEKYEIF